VGQPFDRAALKRLLSNVLYCGEVRHKGKAYPGEQAAMVDRQIWQQAQVLLRKSTSVDRARRRPGALLQDVLHCGVCGSRMVAAWFHLCRCGGVVKLPIPVRRWSSKRRPRSETRDDP
jgi:hypothetical protein